MLLGLGLGLGDVVLLDALDTEGVGRRAHGDDELVVRQLEAPDLARDSLAHHALARHRLGHVVDRGRLRLEVLCLGVRLARR